MNATAILKASGAGREDAGLPQGTGGNRGYGGYGGAPGIALWAFIGVATSLFSLFIIAYAMRMDGADWHPIAMPWQLWLSSTLLAAGSIALQQASSAARAIRWRQAQALLRAGGLFAFAFLGVQLWAWQALLAGQVTPTGNPAGSFFYLLTAMHGLHVGGGLVAWGITLRRARQGWSYSPQRLAWSIALCARYWHFLLAVWLVLFAALGWLTPEVVRFICGTR
jgi:cytochrome c oxidase subunit 3